MNDLLILAMLSEGPRHGYQLKRQAGFIFGHGDIHNNLVYPLLRKFTVDGWVTKKAVPGERGQTRQQYAITPLGKTILLQRLSEYSEADARSFEGFIVRVGLFELLDRKVRASILGERASYLRQQQEKLGGLPQKVEVGKFGGEVVRHLQKRIAFELSWIDALARIH
jgi:DNA-binding PadR family transcriptional regulator